MLVSNDISNSRAKALLKNIELHGINNALVLSEAPDKLERYFPEYFDKILVDAPCSGKECLERTFYDERLGGQRGRLLRKSAKEIVFHGLRC